VLAKGAPSGVCPPDGSRVGIAEASIVDVDGKRYAHATTTCLIFPLS
jgi:acyl-coenzyme A thioesterase PaaI-like protein